MMLYLSATVTELRKWQYDVEVTDEGTIWVDGRDRDMTIAAQSLISDCMSARVNLATGATRSGPVSVLRRWDGNNCMFEMTNGDCVTVTQENCTLTITTSNKDRYYDH